jgi:uncharacterized protein (TIGR00369 family)
MAIAASRGELEQALSESPFARIYRPTLDSFGPGECTLIVPFNAALERPGGIIAGSVLMSAADVAMWLAIMTRLGVDEVTVTSEMSTTFLGSAKQEQIHCTARVVKLGTNLIFGVAECSNGAGKRFTHHTITYVRVPVK